ncbi:disease resistance protein RGA2 [Setaria italica]|uniref:disease resistance protein RGA2 n=1 Tax=Setaria italica TaxID=4555 RepID=UPI000BE4B1E4|nr:disease resistance protein RGA2 [Setaria italica]
MAPDGRRPISNVNLHLDASVLGELASRSINFFTSKSSKPRVLDVEGSLQRALLRAQVIIDEATGRHITNQAMLQQLDMLRNAMYQGCYKLDAFRYQHHDEKYAEDQVVSHSFFVSKVNSMKGICSSKRKTQILEQLEDALDNLSTMIIDMKELVLFLTSYPHLYRQPYSMHLLLGKCMFGRQMEAYLVLNFLLHTQPNGAEELEVLPVVGPIKVGKSTLVAHVCNDERVRDHFSEIMFLSNHDFKYEKLTYLREGCVKKHQNSTPSKYGRMLVVVEATGDFNEDEWKRLYASSKQCMASGSKIIITSRSDKITKLGTTRAVTLKYLSEEAYWYFFKTHVFGSTDPTMHPRMAYVAMEIARMLNRSLNAATTIACLLRDKFGIHFWCKVLTFLRGLIKWHVSSFGEHPGDALRQYKPAHLRSMVRTSEEIVVHHQYNCSSQEEVPKISLASVMYGNVKPPSGKFEALVWRSPIPPCYNYIYTCEIWLPHFGLVLEKFKELPLC